MVCGFSLYVYQFKPTGWKAYVLKEREAKRREDAKWKAEHEARHLVEQRRQNEEEQEQSWRRWARRVSAKPSNFNGLFYLESLRPPVDTGRGSIVLECNAVVEFERPQVERLVRGRRFLSGFYNKVSTQDCSSD